MAEPHNTTAGSGRGEGAVFIFRKSATGWQLDQTIAAPATTDSLFGGSLAINNNMLMVGSSNNTGHNSVYMFQYEGTIWDRTNYRNVFVPNSTNIATAGKWLAVGSPGDDYPDNNVGAVIIYDISSSNQSSTMIRPVEGYAHQYFGTAVAMDGERLIVGSLPDGTDSNSRSRSGVAFVYRWDNTTSSWLSEGRLEPSSTVDNDQFGSRVDIKGDWAIVGAWDDNATATGTAWLFQWDGSVWVERERITPTNGAARDHFGSSVALSDAGVLVGSPYDDKQGRDSGAVWFYSQSMISTTSGSGDDRLIGGSGHDTLIGGEGADQFAFTSPADEADIIADFNVSQGDQLVFDSTNFALSVGTLDSAQFVINETGLATESSQRFIFNNRTGRLYYDADGSDSQEPNEIVQLKSISTLSSKQIEIADIAGDTIAPQLSLPAILSVDDAGAVVVGTNIVFTFDESVRIGAGSIVISNGTGDTRILSASDSRQVSVRGDQLIINPAENLNFSTTYSVQITKGTVVDAAGNLYEGTTEAAKLQFTTSATAIFPMVLTNLDLADMDDTGSSNSDNITKKTSSLTISGAGDKGTTVTLFDDKDGDTLLGSSESLATIKITDDSGEWNRDLSLLAGTYSIRTIQEKGGDTSISSDALLLTVDTTAPAAPSVPDLDADDDSTTSNTSGLGFSGSGEIGAMVTLFVDKNNNKRQDSSERALTTTTVDSSGQWNAENLALAIGTYSLVAFQTDVAGNIGAVSDGLRLSIVRTAQARLLRDDKTPLTFSS
ncbi:MAG: Ig-like domain-containing protein [Magnetococcales bacterium]|nr:Ig-like domain-containing protein [Magnetococcales bacterium]